MRVSVLSALGVSLAASALTHAIPPTPDHVVIVVEENHAYSQVIGYPGAPYMNGLATSGASFTSFYAHTHPSQPNYIEFFSGANQGVTTNSVPVGIPFTTPNLGGALLAAGRTFVGYSEDQPSVGYQGAVSGHYMRKHNPWANWQFDPPGLNQIPSALNKPFFTAGGASFYGDTAAPTDYSTLPHVSIVVPNQLNDMHDGTIDMADDWLELHIKPYADWAMNNNSLLIIAWDEDNSAERNHIANILYGPMIVPGQYPQTYTLHNLLRTIGDMYGAAPAGNGAKVRPIVGCFTTDPPIATKSFRQGTGGYVDAHDTWIENTNPNTAHGSDTSLTLDSSPLTQGLIRFDNIIGVAPAQVPQGATVLSAKLVLLTGPAAGDNSINPLSVYPMLAPWVDASTWNTLVGGVSRDNIEAAATAEFTLLPNTLNTYAIFDVTTTAQSIVNTPASNQGWLIFNPVTDNWRTLSSETAVVGDRPRLEITYDPTSCRAAIDQQPTATRILAGNPLVLTVTASNPNPITYRWRKNTIDLIDGGDISGATTNTLTINPSDTGDTGSYDVVVTNVCGDVPSIAVSVLVCAFAPNGDMNGDSAINGLDIPTFVDATLAGSALPAHLCPGDFSLNSQMDLADINPFITALVGP
jgi:phosphatidylinositol-3-phosphatase